MDRSLSIDKDSWRPLEFSQGKLEWSLDKHSVTILLFVCDPKKQKKKEKSIRTVYSSKGNVSIGYEDKSEKNIEFLPLPWKENNKMDKVTP